jgi:Flp pilus assembly protein TadD
MSIKQRHILFLISAALVAAIAIAYEPVRHNGFVSYDDYAYITENPNVTGGITRDSVIWAFTKTYASNWHPLTWLSHMADCEIYGLNPAGHHITNVLIHIANSLLLFWVLRKMTDATWRSAFVAAAFALHPLHVESVAWVAERKDVLSGLFWMLTMAAYVRYAERPNIQRYLLVLLAFVMGLMSKPMVVTLPFVLLLLDYWPLERLNWGRPPAGKTVPLGRLLVEKVPLLLLSAILSVITFVVQQGGGAVIALGKIPLDYRIANMFVSYIRYIGKTIWPSGLAVLYPHPHINPSGATAVVYALLFVLITVISIDIFRRRKYIAVGWLWYVGTLVPVAGLVQVGSQGMADRYTYIPMVGLLIVAGWGVKDLVANRPRWKVVAAALAVVVLASAVILTRMQVKHWQNSITLFEYALKVTENNAGAETSYGGALAEAGRFDEAELHLSNAVRLNPTAPKAHNHLGNVLLNEGKLNEAIEHFNEALRITPDQAAVYVNLSIAYTKLGKYEQAIQNWTRAVELEPTIADILKNPAWLLATAGNVSAQDADRAIEFARRACELGGYKEAELLDTLAAAYAAAGRFEDAVRTAQQAIDAAKAGGREDLAGEIKNRMELYKTGQRYRQK